MFFSLNDNIKKMRVLRGLSQVEFAKIIGVTKQCVSNWENDNVMPSVEMLVKLADYFGVTTDYILGRSGKNTIDVSGLTEVQLSHISLIIEDMVKLNRN